MIFVTSEMSYVLKHFSAVENELNHCSAGVNELTAEENELRHCSGGMIELNHCSAGLKYWLAAVSVLNSLLMKCCLVLVKELS